MKQIAAGHDGERPSDSAFEQHYSISELAKLWGLGRESVRKLVMNEPDVTKVRMGKKKKNTHYTVSESVAKRIHTRLSNAA